MNQKIEIKDTLSKSATGTYLLCDAVYQGTPCYCICHSVNDYAAVFSYDEKIMKAIKKHMKKFNPSITPEKTGSGFIFIFEGNGRESGISLKLLLWAKYNHLPKRKCYRLKIDRIDRSAETDHILDLRKDNLYDAGGINLDGISIIEHPITEEKFIAVQRKDKIEVQYYSDELYQILTTRGICRAYQLTNNGKIATSVHYADKNETNYPTKLSALVLIYRLFFGKYQNMSGGIIRFVKAFPELKARLGEMECGHVNALDWNNCAENIMPMLRATNLSMGSIARQFGGRYVMRPFAWRGENGESKILVEWDTADGLTYYVCSNPEEYCHLQKMLAGRLPLTQRLTSNITELPMDTMDGRQKQYPPMEELKNKLWEWCDSRDRVLGLYAERPETFMHWKTELPIRELPRILSAFGIRMGGPGYVAVEKTEQNE